MPKMAADIMGGINVWPVKQWNVIKLQTFVTELAC